MSPDPINLPGLEPRPDFISRLLGLRKHLSWKQAFTSLRHPNYRLWFWSQIVSLFGVWMESTALGFLVFELTKSPAYLGLVGFMTGVPTWVFMLYAGVIADRVPRRTLLMITQTVMMMLAFAVAALTFLHWIQPWHILVMAFLLGTANAFEAPARQSFVLEMVDHRGHDQRHRPQLGHVQRGHGRRADGRRPDLRLLRSGLVLRHQRPVLHRRHHRAPADEARAVRAQAPTDLGPGRPQRGPALRRGPSADPDDHRAHRGRQHFRHLVHHPPSRPGPSTSSTGTPGRTATFSRPAASGRSPRPCSSPRSAASASGASS